MEAMQSSEFDSLVKHMEWADALTWKAVLARHDAQQDGRLLDLLYHLHVVQWLYLQFFRGEPISVPERSSFPDVAAVVSWARPYYPQLHAWAQTLAPGQLLRIVEFPWAAEVAKRYGSSGPVTLGESLLQVLLHSTYHRGQIATRIRELGGEPPLTDFIAWAWMERPAPEW